MAILDEDCREVLLVLTGKSPVQANRAVSEIEVA